MIAVHTPRWQERANLLRDIENAMVADAVLIHDCRWKARAARQRNANRREVIDRLRTELGVTP